MKCRLKSCKKQVGPVAARAGDPYCSSLCCRIDHGVLTPSEARELQQRHERQVRASKDTLWREAGNRSFAKSGRKRVYRELEEEEE